MKLWWYFSGLHTCGNLAPASLRIFLANPTMKLCYNVGCCYHLLDEEFYTTPYQVDDQDVKTPNFPLSSILRERQFWLGRKARMVAAQPMDRAINNQQVKKMRAKRVIFVWFLCSNSFFFHSSSYAIIWRKKNTRNFHFLMQEFIHENTLLENLELCPTSQFSEKKSKI